MSKVVALADRSHEVALVYSAGGPPRANYAVHLRPRNFAVVLERLEIKASLYDTGYYRSRHYSIFNHRVEGLTPVPETALEAGGLRSKELPKFIFGSFCTRRKFSTREPAIAFQFPTMASLSLIGRRNLIVDMAADGIDYYPERSWLRIPARILLGLLPLISYRTECYLHYLREKWGFEGRAFKVSDVVSEEIWTTDRGDARRQLSVPQDVPVVAVVGRTGVPALRAIERVMERVNCITILAGRSYLVDRKAIEMKSRFGSRVVLTGAIRQSEVAKILSIADAIPLWYGTEFRDVPQKFPECVSSNARVVSTEFDGIREIADFVDYLVDLNGGDPEGRFEECLEQSLNATERGRAAKNKARTQFSERTVTGQVKALIESVSASY